MHRHCAHLQNQSRTDFTDFEWHHRIKTWLCGVKFEERVNNVP